MEKKSFWESFKICFGIGALVFGTYCGANMASGAYAAGYIVTVGGGWALVWLAMFLAFMSFFCVIGLNFVRSYKIKNYSQYYTTLWGVHRPGTNPVLKGVVTVFFDIYSLFSGLITVAATVALFATLMNSLFNIPVFVASLGGVILFAILTVNGAGFLRKFNTLMTVSLLVCLAALLFAVIANRGDVLAERLGNFQIGTDWTGTTVMAHFGMFLSYCWSTSSWGSSMCNYAEKITTKKLAIGSGIMVGILVTSLFAITSLIVLPYMPEAMSDAPILKICQQYLPGFLTAVYWVVVVFSVVSTAPTFTFNMANRWVGVWKTDKVSRKVKFFVLSSVYLIAAWLLSGLGLMTIVQKGYVIMGNLALPAVVLPLLFSIYRVWKHDRAEEKLESAQSKS
ncbi:hypothetical protein [Feifania hominis]|uniref:Amino acid permease n=1 Tax=Feifania hominis TaxID=2763660 RepID=A0A926DE95_9FIRM|nr:hypothetical protein [Feifania hominis]MBC8535724.1 hypothetical protein [Feifania hominis]